MDSGVLEWPCNTSICVSHCRDEYITKKYVEKRWVATYKVPDIPAGKMYRKQETWVIDFVSAEKLERSLKGKNYPSEPFTFSQAKPLKMLKRGENIENDLSRQNAWASGKRPHSYTVSPPESTIEKSDTEGTDDTLTSDQKVRTSLETTSFPMIDIDFKIPDTFKFDVMSPDINYPECTLSDSSSSAPEIYITGVSTASEMDATDAMVTVCDVGVQTD